MSFLGLDAADDLLVESKRVVRGAVRSFSSSSDAFSFGFMPPPRAMMVRPLRGCVQGCIGLRVEQRTARHAKSFMTIGEAATLLGVSEMTLRRWDKAGKFKARRHPINRYRVYRRAEVLRLRTRIERGVA